MKFLPECGSEPYITVRYHGNWHPVSSHYLSNVDISQLLGRNALLDCSEMGTLGQPIHGDPNQIHSLCGPGNLCDEIYSNILPFPHRDIQRLRLAVRSLVLGLDLPASQASLSIPGYIPLHAGPPVIRAKMSF